MKKTRKELERKVLRLKIIIFWMSFFLLVFVVSYIVLGITSDYKINKLEQQLSECQDKVPYGQEINVTIEGFDRLKLQLWCWWKDYPYFDSNSSYIWEIVKNCEVLD